MLRKLLSYVANVFRIPSGLNQECALRNANRIRKAGILVILLEIIAISALIFYGDSSLWEKRIILLNVVNLTIFCCIIFPISLRVCHSESLPLAYFLQYFTFAVFMLFGVLIGINDGLIASFGISAFSMVSLILGTMMLLPPAAAVTLYPASFILFCLLVIPTLPTKTLILANIINGLTATAASTLLAIIMWNDHKNNIQQKKRIEEQRVMLEQANAKLAQIAYHDPLTGLPNRRYLDDALKKETALMLRKGHASCLMIMDIDYFKSINDSHGHPTGDELLVQISRLLTESIRQYDTLCRLGGEEFMILLPQTTLDEATAVAKKLCCRIAAQTFHVGNTALRVTASIGVSQLLCSADASLTEQYANADKALYLAKRSGRNCVKAL